MRIVFFDGADRLELGTPDSVPGRRSMPQARSRAIRIDLREPWQAARFLHRHFVLAGDVHRLRTLLSARLPLVHLLDNDEVCRQVSGMLSSGELCAYADSYPRPVFVPVPAPTAGEDVVAPASSPTRRPRLATAPATSVDPPAPVVLTFVEIELVDMQGQPVAGESYLIALPDGREHSGVLDEFGRARVEGVEPGNCRVIFPQLDRQAVERR